MDDIDVVTYAHTSTLPTRIPEALSERLGSHVNHMPTGSARRSSSGCGQFFGYVMPISEIDFAKSALLSVMKRSAPALAVARCMASAPRNP
jgi:hypothetical protein